MRHLIVPTFSLVLTAVSNLGASSCSNGLNNSVSGKQAPERRIVDSVLQITSGATDPSIAQPTYIVNATQRVLLRYESFMNDVDRIYFSSDGTYGVGVLVTAANSTDFSAARTALRLCPLTRSWMNSANWEQAHPFGPEGAWTQPGGDHDVNGCITARATPDSDGPGVLYFDMTQWALNYVRGARTNHGLVLLSTGGSILLAGDISLSSAPQIRYYFPDQIGISTKTE